MRLRSIVLVLALGCAACEMEEEVLHSERPLFTFKDPSATLKPGVWVTDQRDCDIDRRLPAAEWPECAAVAVVSDAFMGDWPTRFPYVITPGSPRVLQIGYTGDHYAYEIVTALEYDAEGRVTAIRRDSLACTADLPAPDPGEDPVAPAPMARGPSLPCPAMDADAVLDLAEEIAPKDAPAPNFRWMRDTLE